MRAYMPLIMPVVASLCLAACASEPAKPPGVFDLSNGLDRPAPWTKDPSSSTGASEVGAMGVPAPDSVGNSIGAPTTGHVGGGSLFGN